MAGGRPHNTNVLMVFKTPHEFTQPVRGKPGIRVQKTDIIILCNLNTLVTAIRKTFIFFIFNERVVQPV